MLRINQLFPKIFIPLMTALCIALSACSDSSEETPEDTAAVENAVASENTGWNFHQVAMGGGGFVSGVFATNQDGLYYARTDVGGAYRYDKDRGKGRVYADNFGNKV